MPADPNCHDCAQTSPSLCRRHHAHIDEARAKKNAYVQALTGHMYEYIQAPISPDRLKPYVLPGWKSADYTALVAPDRMPFAFVTARYEDFYAHFMTYMIYWSLGGTAAAMEFHPQTFKALGDLDLISLKFSKEKDADPFLDAVSRPDVLVVRLGLLRTTNKDAAGAVYEAVQQRKDRNLKTIVINEPNTPWRPSHKAYSEDLSAYLDRDFVAISIRAARDTNVR